MAMCTYSGYPADGFGSSLLSSSFGARVLDCRFVGRALFSILTCWLVLVVAGCGSGTVLSGGSLQVSPGNLDFGDVTVGQSTVKIVTLQNAGSAPITISQLSFSSTAFSIASGENFPISLPAGGAHSISVGFTPVSAADYSAQLIFVDSTSKPMTQLPVHGRGQSSPQLNPQLSVSTDRLDFGSVTIGSSAMRTLTLTSAGTSPVTISSETISGAGFSLVGGNLPATMNPNQSVTLQIWFSPTAAGAASGQLTINSDSITAGTATVALSATSVAAPNPQLTVSAGSLNFGSVTANTWTLQALTLTSTGTAPVTVSAATVTGARFSLVGGSLPATLNPSQSLTLQVQFSPMDTGTASGQLTINSNSAAGSTMIVTLSGTGTTAPNPQLTVSSASLSFGNVTVNGSTSQTLTLTSTGTTALTVSSPTISGAGFSIVAQSFPVTLNPTQSLTLQVQFSPTNAGSVNGQMTISSNSTSGAIAGITLSGTGVIANPQLTISTTNLDFGSVALNTPVRKSLILSSTGSSPVILNSATVSGTGFSLIGGSFPVTMNPTQTLTLQIQFLPTGPGAQTGQVTLVSTSTNGATSTVTLSGSGAGGNHEVDLTWGAPTNSPTPVAGYNVYRSTGSSGSFGLINSPVIASSAYIDTSVVSGLSYTYIVKSVDSSGTESVPSNQITVTIP